MALKTFVKISGVNNLSDARYCAGMEVDQLGFNIEKDHPNYTDDQKFKEISEWLSGVSYVGETESDTITNLGELVNDYQLDAIQVSSPALIDTAKTTSLPVILKINYSQLENIEPIMQANIKDVQYFLIESEEAMEAPADLLKLADQYPIVLGFGFSTDTIENLITAYPSLKGISLKGGAEIKPGLRDFDEMADVLESLEVNDLD